LSGTIRSLGVLLALGWVWGEETALICAEYRDIKLLDLLRHLVMEALGTPCAVTPPAGRAVVDSISAGGECTGRGRCGPRPSRSDGVDGPETAADTHQ